MVYLLLFFLTFFGTKLYDVIMYYPKFHIEQKKQSHKYQKKVISSPVLKLFDFVLNLFLATDVKTNEC